MILKRGDDALMTGKIVRDPEMRVTKTEKQVTNFAIKYGYDKEQQTGLFMDISIWDTTIGKSCVELLRKGDPIMVAGTLSSREYEGKTKWSITADFIVPDISVINAFLPSDGADSADKPAEEPPAEPQQEFVELSDDEPIPF